MTAIPLEGLLLRFILYNSMMVSFIKVLLRIRFSDGLGDHSRTGLTVVLVEG